MKYWFFLLGAILFEVVGTISMKYSSDHNENSGFFLMLLFIAISYYLLSLAMKKIPLGVAYSLWEGIGLIVITGAGYLLFSESLTIIKALGVAGIIFSSILIHRGSYSIEESSAEGNSYATTYEQQGR